MKPLPPSEGEDPFEEFSFLESLRKALEDPSAASTPITWRKRLERLIEDMDIAVEEARTASVSSFVFSPVVLFLLAGDLFLAIYLIAMGGAFLLLPALLSLHLLVAEGGLRLEERRRHEREAVQRARAEAFLREHPSVHRYLLEGRRLREEDPEAYPLLQEVYGEHLEALQEEALEEEARQARAAEEERSRRKEELRRGLEAPLLQGTAGSLQDR